MSGGGQGGRGRESVKMIMTMIITLSHDMFLAVVNTGSKVPTLYRYNLQVYIYYQYSVSD